MKPEEFVRGDGALYRITRTKSDMNKDFFL